MCVGDGCLRAGIVPSRPGMSSRSPLRRFFAPRGDPDVRDGLRAGRAQVPARGVRRQRQLRPPARGLPDLGRRHVDRHARDAGAEPGARRRAGDDAGRSPAAAGVGGAARDRGRAAAVGADPLRRRVAGARRLGAGDGSGARAALGRGARASCATSTRTRCRVPADGVPRLGGAATDFTAPLARRHAGARRSPTARALVERALADPGWRADRRRWIAPCAPSRSWPRRARSRAGARRAGWWRRWRDAPAAAPRGRRGSAHATATRGAARGRRQRAGAPCAARCCCACRARRRWTTRSARALPRRAARGGRRAARARRRGAVAPAARERACAGGRWRPASRWRRSGTVVEAVLFRALFDGAGRPLFAIVVALLAALLALELPLAWGLRRAGAALEERFRDLFMRKIPRLGDRYFQSRPVSDMAERAHLVHKLRALPTLAGDIARTALEIVVIAAALVWLDPRGAALAIALAAAMLLHPAGGAAGGGRARSAHAQPRGRARALLPRRAAGAGGGADARRRAGAGARAPGPAARVGARGARGAARGAGGRGGAGAGRVRPGAPGCSSASSRARAGTTRAPRCWPSTGRCRCRCSGYELALLVQQVPGAAQPDAAPGRAAGRARGARRTTPRRARGRPPRAAVARRGRRST